MNNNEQSIQDALYWLRFASDDLRAASRMMEDDPPLSRHACWNYQQAAEKALKAVLVLEKIPFPHTHDMDALWNLLPKDWITPDVDDDLVVLTEWAVDARYPGYGPEPNQEDAIEAEAKSRPVCDMAEAEFKRRGILN